MFPSLTVCKSTDGISHKFNMLVPKYFPITINVENIIFNNLVIRLLRFYTYWTVYNADNFQTNFVTLSLNWIVFITGRYFYYSGPLLQFIDEHKIYVTTLILFLINLKLIFPLFEIFF
jgi:hypothetical protein